MMITNQEGRTVLHRNSHYCTTGSRRMSRNSGSLNQRSSMINTGPVAAIRRMRTRSRMFSQDRGPLAFLYGGAERSAGLFL